MKNINLKLNNGLTLVEVVVATSIVLVFLLALFAVSNLYLRTVFLNTKSVKATFIAEEGLEALRFLRNVSWDANIATLSNDTDYGLVLDSGSWEATTTNIYIDNTFERFAVLSAVYRDVFNDIVSSGGTLDPDTKLVTGTVSWNNGSATTTKVISTYLANILDE